MGSGCRRVALFLGLHTQGQRTRTFRNRGPGGCEHSRGNLRVGAHQENNSPPTPAHREEADHGSGDSSSRTSEAASNSWQASFSRSSLETETFLAQKG